MRTLQRDHASASASVCARSSRTSSSSASRSSVGHLLLFEVAPHRLLDVRRVQARRPSALVLRRVGPLHLDVAVEAREELPRLVEQRRRVRAVRHPQHQLHERLVGRVDALRAAARSSSSSRRDDRRRTASDRAAATRSRARPAARCRRAARAARSRARRRPCGRARRRSRSAPPPICSALWMWPMTVSSNSGNAPRGMTTSSRGEMRCGLHGRARRR